MRMFTTKEGDAGFALNGNDIVSVFKHPNAPYRNVTRSMLDLAVQHGGKRLDAFDTVLPHIYGQNGFRAVARLPFSEEHKPKGWMRDTFRAFNQGAPDVVFMAHDPQAGAYNPGDGRTVSDYDEGTAAQHAALAHVAARGNVPAAPGPESYGSGQLIRSADPLTVWHGTPHEFAPTRANPLGEFNLSKLGTGEGAQAYGHGIYKAGNKGVAEGYQSELAKGVTYQGNDAFQHSRTDPHVAAVHAVAEHMVDNGHTPEEAIERVRNEHEDAAANAFNWSPRTAGAAGEANRERGRFYRDIAWAVQKLKPEHFAHDKGHLYESELHIHPDHMLDWDKPISEHHPYVQGRLQKMFGLPEGYVPDTMGGWVNADRATGRDVHDVLAKHPGGHDRPAAAQQLLDAGIPGIKYLDSGSRTHAADAQRLRNQIAMMGPGTPQRDIDVAHQRLAQTEARISHNYVVFDPRTINIVKRNGLPAMVDAGADALRDHKASS
jgi:hypothetical protein